MNLYKLLTHFIMSWAITAEPLDSLMSRDLTRISTAGPLVKSLDTKQLKTAKDS